MVSKTKAQQLCQKAIRDGVLDRQPCEKCGTEKVHAHHTDYSKPLDVMWLCPKHHKEWHKNYGCPEGKNERAVIFVSPETHAQLTRLVAKEIVKNKGRRVTFNEMFIKLINSYKG